MNADEILDQIFKITRKKGKKIEHIFLYGSNQDLQSEEKDIDLLVILKGHHEYSNIENDQLDIIFLGFTAFFRAIINFEPLVLEPILTGKCIYGEKEDYQKLINSQEINLFKIIYLLNSSYTLMVWAKQNFDQSEFKSCLINLSWALSYYLMAKSLKNDEKYLSFQEMLKLDSPLNQVIKALKSVSQKQQNTRKLLDLSTQYLTQHI